MIGTPAPHRSRLAALALAALACAAALLLLQGCTGRGSEQADETDQQGAGMAGPVVDVEVTQAAIESTPTAPVLTSPELAVRSYLEWVSYAYRIGQSQVARATMTTAQEVHVDSYVQYNLQQSRLLDQTLLAATFGAPVIRDGSTLVPVKETWQYRYISATEAGTVLGGPYEVTYDATYTVVPSASGTWAVDAVEATTQDPVR
jgi:hypothetical protein